MRRLLCFAIFCLSFISCKKYSDPITTPTADSLGTGWTKVTIATENIADIYFINDQIGFAVGENGYKSTDGGHTWRNTFFFGSNGNIAATPNSKVFVVNYSDFLYRSFDGGDYFSRIAMNSGGVLSDIFFTDNDTGYLPGFSKLYQTVDGGLTWPPVNPAEGLDLIPDNLGLSTMNIPYFINSTTGWISNGDEVYRTNGSINNWSMATFDVHPDNGFLTLHAPNPTTVYLGSVSGIYKSTDGGSNFSLLPALGTSLEGYVDIHFVDGNNGYVCSNKKIYKTSDGGNSWQVVVRLYEDYFSEIHFTNATHGWACGSKGLVLIFNS